MANNRENAIDRSVPSVKERERFTLHVTALPDSVPAVIRLRKALKCLLRSFRLRCTAARETGEPVGEADDREEGEQRC
jgi:hypothetical protein